MAKQIVNKEEIVAPVGTVEDYQRSNHPDFATAGELRNMQFTGMRSNSITDDMEIWESGEIKATVTQRQIAMNPNAIQRAIEDVFSLHEVVPDIPELRAYRLATGKD